MPDARWGEVPRAFVVLRPGQRDHRAGADRALPVAAGRLQDAEAGRVLGNAAAEPRRARCSSASCASLDSRCRRVTKCGQPRSQQAQSRSSRELPTESLLEAYGRMTLIRLFEERVSELYRNSEVPGFVHLSIGQEAAAVGACWPLAVTDVITSNHRGHGHCLAKGLAPEPMMAELLARVTGTNKGLGGSMHIADPDLGIFGANGIVARGRADRRGARPLAGAERRGQGQRRGGVVLRRRRGRAGRLPRGGQPGRAVAAADRVLLREQRLRGVLADRRPAPGADGRPRRRVRP